MITTVPRKTSPASTVLDPIYEILANAADSAVRPLAPRRLAARSSKHDFFNGLLVHVLDQSGRERAVQCVGDRDCLLSLLAQDQAGEGVRSLVRRREGVVVRHQGR